MTNPYPGLPETWTLPVFGGYQPGPLATPAPQPPAAVVAQPRARAYLQGRDAAFPGNLAGWGGVVLGYFGGPRAFNVWTPDQWFAFRGQPKIPMWVAGTGPKNGTDDGTAAVRALRALGVPRGKVTLVDMETGKDRTYLEAYGDELKAAGYKTWVYGSVSTLFGNPQLNGYAVADPTGVMHMYPHPGVRMTQWAFGPLFDQDVIREWLMQQDDLWI